MELGVIDIVLLVCIVLAVIDIINSQGRALTSWAVAIGFAALVLLT